MPEPATLPAALLDLRPADGGVALRLEPGARQLQLTPDACEQRARLLGRAWALTEAHGSSHRLGDPMADARAEAAEAAWGAVRAWDAKHVGRWVLANTSTGRRWIAYPARNPFEDFSLPMALDTASPDHRLIPLPLWAGAGAVRALDLCARHAIPQISPNRTTIAIASPPPGTRAILSRMGASSTCRLGRAVGALAPLLHGESHARRLRAALVDAAEASGLTVLDEPDCRQLLDVITGGAPGHTLLLIGHQDELGLHCMDGVLSLRRVAAELRHAAAYDAVDLAVCGAGLHGNLAEMMQSTGAPVVLTRGRFALYGRVLAGWLARLDYLTKAPSITLPELHDVVRWQRPRP